MANMEILISRISGLQRTDVERWIVQELILPDVTSDGYVFREVDIARIRLIQELRDDMEVNETALPIVLSLLDQLYELRRQFHELGQALRQQTPDELKWGLARQLAGSEFE